MQFFFNRIDLFIYFDQVDFFCKYWSQKHSKVMIFLMIVTCQKLYV